MIWRLSQNCYPLLVNILKWSSKYSHCSKIYIRSRRFWVKGQLAFFDIRVFDSNAKRYLHSALPQCYTQNVKEKKRQYNKRVLQIEHGGFSPLISYGGMSHNAVRLLSNLLSEKGTYYLRQQSTGYKQKFHLLYCNPVYYVCVEDEASVET